MGTSSHRHELRPCPAHLVGRLTPLAMDNAYERTDSLLFSVPLGGLGQSQIDSFPLGVEELLRWFKDGIRRCLFRRPPR